MNSLKRNFLLIAILLPCFSLAQNRPSFITSLEEKINWVESTFKKMNRREKIAQLFMLRAQTNKGIAFQDSVAHLIEKLQVGGLVFFQGGPARQAELINRYQASVKVPLLIAMDGEWGLGMRLDSTMSYPYQLTLGAIQDHSLIEKMGQQVAIDFKRLGVHVNFAPVVDINNNPNNPVIGFRSFGDDRYQVSVKAGAYMRGMQQEGLLCTIKHFPGHGDTDVDSHLDLPVLSVDRRRLDSLELYPFRQLIQQGASGVMVAHMQIPALDTTAHLPSSLSKPVIHELLQTDLAFKGLVFTDAMEMQGVLKFFPSGEAEVKAIQAGSDLVELSRDTELAIKMIRKALRHKKLSWDWINTRVKKVLAAKYWVGLAQLKPIGAENVAEDLIRPEAIQLQQSLADAAVTLLGEKPHVDFLQPTALISIGLPSCSLFQASLKPRFKDAGVFVLPKNATYAEVERLKAQLKGFKQFIVGVHDARRRPLSKLDYSAELKSFVRELAQMNSILSVFANPYTLADLQGIERCKTILMNYQQNDQLQDAAARVVLGQLEANGRLPVTVTPFFKNGDGTN